MSRKIKVVYIGFSYGTYHAQDLTEGNIPSIEDDFYEVREDLAQTWNEGEFYSEDKMDFSVEITTKREFLLVPYIDPNQLKLFNPETD